MSARNDSAETAARLLDHLEQTGRRELVRRAMTVVTMPPHRKDVNPRAIERHFDQRCRLVLRVPYDRHLDSGAPGALLGPVTGEPPGLAAGRRRGRRRPLSPDSPPPSKVEQSR